MAHPHSDTNEGGGESRFDRAGVGEQLARVLIKDLEGWPLDRSFGDEVSENLAAMQLPDFAGDDEDTRQHVVDGLRPFFGEYLGMYAEQTVLRRRILESQFGDDAAVTQLSD